MPKIAGLKNILEKQVQNKSNQCLYSKDVQTRERNMKHGPPQTQSGFEEEIGEKERIMYNKFFFFDIILSFLLMYNINTGR